MHVGSGAEAGYMSFLALSFFFFASTEPEECASNPCENEVTCVDRDNNYFSNL